jgi:hypothetical protein
MARDEGEDEATQKMANQLDLEAEKITAEECASDPEVRQKYITMKVFARMLREGEFEKSIGTATQMLATMSPQEFDTHVENFQKTYDIDIIQETENFIKLLELSTRIQTPSGSAADDIIRSMFTGK